MTTNIDFDRLAAAWLADGPSELNDRVLDSALREVHMTRQRRAMHAPWRFPAMPALSRGMIPLAAALAVAIAATGLVYFGFGGRLTTTAPPSPPANLRFGPDSSDHDWPGPLRTESSEDAVRLFSTIAFPDPVGDVPSAMPWVDIRSVGLQDTATDYVNMIGLSVAGGLAVIPPPETSWISYGVVLDLNADGLPDQRVGIDNSLPGVDHREWITDLATGRTEVNRTGVFGGFGAFGTRVETWFVDANALPGLWVKREPGGIRFYAWASIISDGRIIATDFAPDSGWIETTSR